MIPRVSVDVFQDLDLDALRSPGRETVDYPGWLGTQRDYDSTFYDVATWELAEQALADERQILEAIDKQARDGDEFEDLASELFDFEAPFLGYLELGVSALSIGLNAAGCVTASSCRGHVGRNDLPQVLLSCDRARGELLLELARRTSCGIQNCELEGLAVYAPSVCELLALAAEVIGGQERFERFGPGPERWEPREEQWA